MRDANQTNAPGYMPRNALIVMSQEDRQYATQVARSLLAQKIRFSIKSDRAEALKYLDQHNVDVLITGRGYDAVANYIETHKDDHGTFTIAVSNNGVRADVKLQSQDDLGSYVKEGLVGQHYLHNSDAQACRKDLDSLTSDLEAMLKKSDN